MSQVIISLLAFLVALGILVTVHEFGHFWVARKMGVKVLRFSVGFGKPIWRYRPPGGETEYVISAVPLGGYVKMLGEGDEVEVPAEEQHRAFNNQSVWKRIAVVAAGPVFNFVLAAVLYVGVFAIGIPGIKPVVGEVQPQSPAARAGFHKGDWITAVESEPVRTWQEVRLMLLDRLMSTETVSLSVATAGGGTTERRLTVSGEGILKQEGDLLANLGLESWRPVVEPVVDSVQADSAAARAGLRPGDRIIRADGRPVESWGDWVRYVRARPDTEIDLAVRRDGSEIHTTLVPQAREVQGETIGFIGVAVRVDENAWDRVRTVVQYPPLESVWKALVKTGDMTLLTFRMIGKLLVGDVSPRNISGPITIAEYAGKTAQLDFGFFLDFLAIVSIGLGVLNILSIPLLDGGHLLYYAIEIVKGRPLSDKAQLIGQQIGIVIIICLMSLAFYNDITRLVK